MPRLSAEPRRDHRQRIMAAARRSVGGAGYCHMRADHVPTEAAASKGSFYRYFTGKHDVLLSVLKQDAVMLERRITSVMNAITPGMDRLHGFHPTTLVEHRTQRARMRGGLVGAGTRGVQHPLPAGRGAASAAPATIGAEALRLGADPPAR